MKYYIYKTTNLINGKIYIGFHASENIEKDNYLGSGKILKWAVEKNGPENFKREILFEFDTQEDALEKERELVNEEFVNRDDTYNICLGGSGGGLPGELNPFFGKTHTAETRKILSEKHSGKILTDEHKQNISNGLKNNESTIRDRCLAKNNNKVNSFSVNHDSKLNKTMIGKTWAELGWGFEPVEKKNV